jgi:hypothetical protein
MITNVLDVILCQRGILSCDNHEASMSKEIWVVKHVNECEA